MVANIFQTSIFSFLFFDRFFNISPQQDSWQELRDIEEGDEQWSRKLTSTFVARPRICSKLKPHKVMWRSAAQNCSPTKFLDMNLLKDFMDKRSLKSTELCSWRFCVFWNKMYLLKSQYWAVSLALLSKQSEWRDVWASNLSRSKFGETNQARGLPASRLTIDKRLC